MTVDIHQSSDDMLNDNNISKKRKYACAYVCFVLSILSIAILSIYLLYFKGIEFITPCNSSSDCETNQICSENICLFETSYITENITHHNYDVEKFDTPTIWNNSIIYFQIDQNLPHISIKEITKSINYLHQTTNISFKPYKFENSKVIFTSTETENSCFSMIGKFKGWQKINIGLNCRMNTVIHEILHTLGWGHEHTRPDRNDYIDVLYDNIIDDKKTAFDISNSSIVWNSIEYMTDYDYDSIMHYSEYTFSKNLKKR